MPSPYFHRYCIYVAHVHTCKRELFESQRMVIDFWRNWMKSTVFIPLKLASGKQNYYYIYLQPSVSCNNQSFCWYPKEQSVSAMGSPERSPSAHLPTSQKLIPSPLWVCRCVSLWRDTCQLLESIYSGLAFSIRGSVHCHHDGKHGSTWHNRQEWC